MRNIALLFFIVAAFAAAAQKPAVIKITDLEKRLNAGGDTTFIVNLWATWCKPCVAELPDFEKITEKYTGQKVKVLLVSIDFVEDLDSKVVPFLDKKQLRSEVVLLDEMNGNYFIPKVSEKWTGAIPATLVRNTAKGLNEFYEKQVSFELLDEVVKRSQE
jgi:thiol-disulfide isomerase/thioredoxin